jgi:group II intron reverse transcriptase/maturase
MEKNLLNIILSDDNLNEAYKRVHKNKGASGVDKMMTSDLKQHLKEHGQEIKEQIRQRKYKPQPVLRVEIPKPDGGVRLLGIPTVTDRFIQQAISQVIGPIFDEQFSDYSYGFRPKRYAEMAIVRALELMNDGYKWIVDIDLEKFFDTVHHDKLMRIVSKTIKDGDVISLIRKYLVSGIVIDEQYHESIIGTPQGGNLSPLLSNIMLNELDKELEIRGLNFVRYADDCLILVGSEKAAKRVMERITKFIEEELGLKVNATKSKVSEPKDIKFLGFAFYWNKYQYQFKAKPHAKSVEKLKEKIKQMTSRSWGTSLDNRLRSLKYVMRGWFNYFKKYLTKTFCKREIDPHTRYRLRMVIWKQWKKVSKRFSALQALGVNRAKAWEWANTRKKYARVAMSYIMTTTVTNERLAKRGFLSMETLYNNYHI